MDDVAEHHPGERCGCQEDRRRARPPCHPKPHAEDVGAGNESEEAECPAGIQEVAAHVGGVPGGAEQAERKDHGTGDRAGHQQRHGKDMEAFEFKVD